MNEQASEVGFFAIELDWLTVSYFVNRALHRVDENCRTAQLQKALGKDRG